MNKSWHPSKNIGNKSLKKELSPFIPHPPSALKMQPDIFPRINNVFENNFVQNFSERSDIKSDSINLALSTLNMTHNEYNLTSYENLKIMKKMGNGYNYAINNLLHYKN